jgi:O-antigen/teichoic acid export membrane protein
VGNATESLVNRLAHACRRWLPGGHLADLLRHSGWVLGGNTTSAGLSFVHAVIAARVLGVHDFGVLGLILLYADTVNQFFESRVWEATIRYVGKFRAEGDPVRAAGVVKLCLLLDVVTSTLAFGVIFGTAGLVARLVVKDEAAAGWVRWYALAVLLWVPRSTAAGLLRAAGRFDWQAYNNAGAAAVRVAGVLAVAAFGLGLPGVLAVQLIATAFGMAWLLVLAGRAWRELGLAGWRRAPLSSLRGHGREIGRFLLMTNVNSLLETLQQNAEPLLVGYWMDPAAVGLLRVARSLTEFMTFPARPLYATTYPKFVSLFQAKSFADLGGLFVRLTLLTGALGLVGWGFFALGGDRLIRLTYGAQYAPAAPLLQWLAAGVAVGLLAGLVHPFLTATDRVRWSVLATAAATAVQLVLLGALVPRLGLPGVGIAYLGFAVTRAAAGGLGVARRFESVRAEAPAAAPAAVREAACLSR